MRGCCASGPSSSSCSLVAGLDRSSLVRPKVSAASLERLDACLAEWEFGHADLLTTALVLKAADRLDAGRAGARHADFLALSVACGWRSSVDAAVPRGYWQFSDLAGPGPRGEFYPALRNPQNEIFLDWYDQWTANRSGRAAALRERRRRRLKLLIFRYRQI